VFVCEDKTPKQEGVHVRTECTASRLEFEGQGGRRVEGAFDAGRTSTDGGLLLLRELESRRGILRRFARCFEDLRDSTRVQHSVDALIRQRVLALACGYEDLNDHDALRHDALLALASGHDDPTTVLASRSTLNRLECTPANATSDDRYCKILYDAAAIDHLWVQLFLERYAQPPAQIVLDLDATDDPLHGEQEGRFFHGFYRNYCYLPLYIFCGDALLLAKLRRSNRDGCDGALEELQRIVAQIRTAWPTVEIVLRADSGFARENLMAWCEANAVEYVFGLARNRRLQEALGEALAAVREEQEHSGAFSVRRFEELRYRTLSSWSCERRVVGKAEQLRDKSNPRFVVTSLGLDRLAAQPLYEKLYCARGDMENRIKEQQLELFADRTSSHTMRANQLRLWFSSIAYVLLAELRRIALASSVMATAQAGTIRLRLLKVAAIVKVSVRRITLALSSTYPDPDVFAAALARIRLLPT
jgi:hypothetical protein